eukprot:augustus_masked-scaffold_1-processed-gene-20.15-mRNA-1 protein AED:1.00 eAED:1.00 QI:0/0/0/0/1/1/2/0/354
MNENLIWDQRTSLRPPPYKGPLAKYLPGISNGDKVLSGVPLYSLQGHSNNPSKFKVPHYLQLQDPDWVNWEQIERGQVLWKKHAYRAFTSLCIALLSGFSIARFGEVLLRAGYAQSPATAFFRYNATANAILDWFTLDLKEGGDGRASVFKVRQMHEHARRMSSRIISKDFFGNSEEGIPLSQFDMVEVLLGFAGVPLFLMKNLMGVKVTPREEEDMVATWRFLGFLLGIEDKFNCCSSVEEVHACLEEFLSMNEYRFKTKRECTTLLQQSCLDGFGSGTALGSQYFKGILSVVDLVNREKFGNNEKAAYEPEDEAITSFGLFVFKLIGFDFVNNKVKRNGFIISYRNMEDAWT